MLAHLALLLGLAVAAGGINAVAGGGSFLSFPGLLFVGLPVLQANATNATALWPAALGSSYAYRQEIVQQRQGFLLLMIGTSLLGGILGALLLLQTPTTLFERILPCLLGTATLLFVLGSPVMARLQKQTSEVGQAWSPPLIAVALSQLLIAIYGGYFGAGIGILMLTTLRFMGMSNIHAMNGLKTLLVACMSGVAVIVFIIAHTVFWPDALTMMVGASVGGYGGASIARKLNPHIVHTVVIMTGLTMTVYSLVK